MGPKAAYMVERVVVPVPRKLSVTAMPEDALEPHVPPDQTLTVSRWSDGTFRFSGVDERLEPVERSVSEHKFAADPYAAAHWLHYGVWP